jgi:hypothetical protein
MAYMRAPMMMFPASDNGAVQGLVEAVASFFGFLDPHASETGWENDLRELAAPHMAVLIHKRARLLGADLNGNTDPMRWAKELGDFIDGRIWQYLDAVGQSMGRAKTFQRLDDLIAREAAALAAVRQQTPLTSRFDASWAD